MNNYQLASDYQKHMNEIIKEREQWWKEAREAWGNIQAILNMPQFPEEPSKVTFGEAKIYITFRYDKFLIQKIVKAFENSDFKSAWMYTEEKIKDNWSDPYYQYTKNDFEITIYFSDKIEGSTCTRKQIGKEMKEVPVYEWSCEEA